VVDNIPAAAAPVPDGADAVTANPLRALTNIAHRQTRPTTAHDFVRETLRRGILAGMLPAGFQLGQSQIAEMLGVSTTPVREALRDLSAEGLIDFDAYRTASVHRPTRDELHEVYDLRRLLESHAMSKVAAIVDEERLARAERLQDRMDAEHDPAEWLILNAEFHAVLTGACNSPKLESFLDNLRASVALYVGLAIRRNPGRREESNAEHREILAACRDRDVDRAVEVTQIHMDPAREVAETALTTP
jgi:Transcriptional regulators